MKPKSAQKGDSSRKKFTRFAIQTLQKMRSEQVFSLVKGSAPQSRTQIPESLAKEFASRGVIEICKQRKTARINEAGLKFLNRLDANTKKCTKGSADPVNPFAQQHQIVKKQRFLIHGRVEAHSVNIAESPLGWLRSRKGRDGKAIITQEQFDAGERLRADFEMAGMTPQITSRLDCFHYSQKRYFEASNGLLPSEKQLYARQRLEAAISDLGPGLSDVALRICCFLESIASAESEMGWPARSAKVVLRIALDKLACHYKNNHIGKKNIDKRYDIV